jgi:hypothetical protein
VLSKQQPGDYPARKNCLVMAFLTYTYMCRLDIASMSCLPALL